MIYRYSADGKLEQYEGPYKEAEGATPRWYSGRYTKWRAIYTYTVKCARDHFADIEVHLVEEMLKVYRFISVVIIATNRWSKFRSQKVLILVNFLYFAKKL